jgi:hypothetical protein
LEYDAHFGALVRKKHAFPLDGVPLAVGIACLLRQFHPACTRQLLSYLGQFVRATAQHALAYADSSSSTKQAQAILGLPKEVVNTLVFLNQLCHYTSVPRDAVYAFVPPYIFDAVKYAPDAK